MVLYSIYVKILLKNKQGVDVNFGKIILFSFNSAMET